MAKRLEKPKKLSASLTEAAYARLRALNAQHGLSNSYLLIVLLEHLDDYADADRLDAAFAGFIDTYGAPAPTPKGGTDG
ncbi:MAG: hypothetical protein ACFBRM_04710 [Pikeienuella sp.]